MNINIAKIGTTIFKGNLDKTHTEQENAVGNNDFDTQKTLVPASYCLAAANKGGLALSMPTSDEQLNKEAILQSKNYFKDSIITADEKILDGFKDGGRKRNREIICVDRKKDVKLQKIINEVKENVKNLPYYNPETGEYIEKEDYIYDYVKKLEKFNIAEKLPEGKEILLGDIIGTESACCRHLALLFKILSDETGVKTDLVRGEVINPFNSQEEIPHVWNIVELDDSYQLYDCALGFNSCEYMSLYTSENMTERLKHKMDLL